MTNPAPLTIGLTGGIGSGKSSVCNLFAEKGIPVIDTDQIAREVVQPGSEGLERIAEQLGVDFIKPDGQLDRDKLRQTIFANPIKKKILESILHPLIRQAMQQKIAVLKNAKTPHYPFILVAIPLLVEGIKDNQKPDYLDEIWVVDCSVEKQLERAVSRDKQNTQQIKAIIEQQASREARLKWADQVINNQAGLLELQAQVQHVFKKFG